MISSNPLLTEWPGWIWGDQWFAWSQRPTWTTGIHLAIHVIPVLFLTVRASSHVILCHVFQGPPGIAGLPVSTTSSRSHSLTSCLKLKIQEKGHRCLKKNNKSVVISLQNVVIEQYSGNILISRGSQVCQGTMETKEQKDQEDHLESQAWMDSLDSWCVAGQIVFCCLTASYIA